mmetsp:Transcript_37787/g.70021  ORF Transcript_37787/g.70021 Transcript_37787/m.70021 type:complete len:94 (+) Transcript_37787:64-345(+)
MTGQIIKAYCSRGDASALTWKLTVATSAFLSHKKYSSFCLSNEILLCFCCNDAESGTNQNKILVKADVAIIVCCTHGATKLMEEEASWNQDAE